MFEGQRMIYLGREFEGLEVEIEGMMVWFLESVKIRFGMDGWIGMMIKGKIEAFKFLEGLETILESEETRVDGMGWEDEIGDRVWVIGWDVICEWDGWWGGKDFWIKTMIISLELDSDEGKKRFADHWFD